MVQRLLRLIRRRRRRSESAVTFSSGSEEDLRCSVTISYILSELKEKFDQEDVQDSGIQVLRDTVQANPVRNGEILAKSGGIKLILAAYRQYPFNLELQQNVLDILVDVSETSWTIINPKSVQVVCFPLEPNFFRTRNPQLCKSALSLLFKLVHKNQPIGRRGVHTLATVMHLLEDDFHVHQMSLRALNQAAKNKQNWEGICLPHVFSAILFDKFSWGEELEDHVNNLICLQLAHHFQKGRYINPLLLLNNRTKFAFNRAGLIVPTSDPKATELSIHQIITAMDNNEHRWEVQYSALLALLYRSNNKNFQQLNETVDRVLVSMQRHLNIDAIQTTGCLILANLLVFNPSTYVSTAIVSAISLALCHHRDDPWVRAAAMAALGGLFVSRDKASVPNEMAFQLACQNMVNFLQMPDCDWFTQHWAILIITELLYLNAAPQTIDIANTIRNSIHILQDPTCTIVIRDSVLHLFKAVLNSSQNVIPFLTEDGVTAVTDLLMRKDIEVSSTLAHNCLSIIRVLIYANTVLDASDQKKVIQAFAHCLSSNLYQDHPTYENIILNGLGSLLLKSLLCKLDFLEVPGGVQAVIRIAKTRTADYETHFQCFYILLGISTFSWASIDEVESALICTAAKIATVVNKHKLEGNRLESCCSILSLVLKTRPQSVSLILNSGGIDALAWGLKHNNECVTSALEALHHISSKQIHPLHWTHSEAIDAVLRAMARNAGDRNAQEKGIETLFNISETTVVALAVLKQGGILALLHGWAYFGEDETLQNLTFWALWRLIKALLLQAWLVRLVEH